MKLDVSPSIKAQLDRLYPAYMGAVMRQSRDGTIFVQLPNKSREMMRFIVVDGKLVIKERN